MSQHARVVNPHSGQDSRLRRSPISTTTVCTSEPASGKDTPRTVMSDRPNRRWNAVVTRTGVWHLPAR